jgi:hypothetical protein
MQDWDAIKQGKLRTVSQKFKLKDALLKIFEMMTMKAQIKGILFNFDEDFGLGTLPDYVIGD